RVAQQVILRRGDIRSEIEHVDLPGTARAADRFSTRDVVEILLGGIAAVVREDDDLDAVERRSGAALSGRRFLSEGRGSERRAEHRAREREAEPAVPLRVHASIIAGRPAAERA